MGNHRAQRVADDPATSKSQRAVVQPCLSKKKTATQTPPKTAMHVHLRATIDAYSTL